MACIPRRVIVGSVLSLAFLCTSAFAEALKTPIDFFEAFADIQSNVEGDDQAGMLEQLLIEAEAYRDLHAQAAAAWLVTGVIRASVARNRGIGALGLMKQVRRDVERALEIDDEVLGGYGPAFMGRLYFVVPGWPLSFGNDGKAERSFSRAGEIAAEGMEFNYYYALFLVDQKQLERADHHLQLALQTTAHPDRPLWDAYLRKLVREELAAVRQALRR